MKIITMKVKKLKKILAAALPSSDPGQVVHTCLVPLKLRPYGALEI